jgi:hypothetical protein
MTYDPNDQNRNRMIRERDGMSGGAIAAMAIAVMLILGVMFWAFSGDRQVASTDTPPETTGQRTPAPTRTPAPAERAPAPAPAPNAQ